jgi:hypothetical protein
MLLSDALLTALIAGGISILISLLTHFTTVRQMRSEREKLERQLEHQFTERLYNLRLQYYPEAFRITERLGKEMTVSALRDIDTQLKNWKAAEVNLVISNKAQQAFYRLRDLLKKNPEQSDMYSEQQVGNIWRARNRFRGELRRDLGLLFSEDEDDSLVE